MLEANTIAINRGKRQVLSDLSFTVRDGELVGVVGPNGVGKSSLLRALVCLDKPVTGDIHWRGESLNAIDHITRARQIGFLPQSEVPAWSLQVEHLVGLGRSPWRRPLEREKDQDQRAVARAIHQTELEPLCGRTVDQLSGGELRRVLIARVLAGEPQCFVADEPIAALDPYHQWQVMEIFRRHCNLGGSAVMAIHDLTLAARFCDKVLLLNKGKLVAQGTPDEVMTQSLLEQVYQVGIYREDTPNGLLIMPEGRI